MAALTAASWTVTVNPRIDSYRLSRGGLVVKGTLAIGNGTDTYPTGGVPAPAIGQFGFKTTCNELQLYGNNARPNEYLLMYDRANHKVLFYEEESAAAGGPPPECDTAEAPAARTYYFRAEGW